MTFLQQLRGLIPGRDMDHFDDLLAIGARAGLVCSDGEQRALYDAVGAFEAYATMPDDRIGTVTVALFLDACDVFAEVSSRPSVRWLRAVRWRSRS